MAERAVAPEILELAGDVMRPTAVVPFAKDLGSLPGKSGLHRGIESVYGMIRRGDVYFRELVERYGPVFRYRMGPDHIVFVADPDAIWSIVRNEEQLWSSALVWTHYFLGLGPGTTGDGPLMLDFDRHRDARRLLQPAFSAQAIAGYVDDARAIYDATIDDWIRRGRVGFKAEVRRLFARVSARVFMGIDDPREAEMLDRAMADGWHAVQAILKRSPLSIGWRRAKRGYDTLWNELRPRMDQRRNAASRDLLSRICQVKDDASWLDDDTRMRMFIAVMFGAFDTTSSGAASMAYLLAKNVAWQDRLRTEALALGKTPSVDDLKALEEQEWVWKETLRMYSVAGVLSRMPLRDTTIGDHAIPARAFVWALTGVVGRDPKHWTDPERFDPERFSKARAEDKRHKAIFLPFGAGAHACIGAQLAGVEIKAFWHALLTRCRFRLARDYTARHTYLPIGIVTGDVDLVVEKI